MHSSENGRCALLPNTSSSESQTGKKLEHCLFRILRAHIHLLNGRRDFSTGREELKVRRVIITGGLGMVGQHAARNLIVHAGTFEILASGLSGRVPIIERKILDESAHKCFIQCIRCDVSNSEEMRYIVMAQHRSSWLLHASGVIQDSLIAKQTCNFMTSVMAPKAVGIHRMGFECIRIANRRCSAVFVHRIIFRIKRTSKLLLSK